MKPSRARHRCLPRLTGFAVTLAAALSLLAGCGSPGLDGQAAPAASPTAVVSSSTPAPAPAEQARRVGSVLPQAPSSVTLPNGVSVPVRAVSTTRNGVLDVPKNIRAAGWWRGGSRIGDPFGSTLVAAHVDSSTQGLGPFASLLSIRPGARIRLTTPRLRQDFRVASLRLRPRGSISARSYLHSPDGPRRLTLVTCAPPYVVQRGGYQNLAIVVAVPLGPVTARNAS